MVDPEEYIIIHVIEEKFSFHSMKKFSTFSSILNYVHSLPVIVSKNEEKFDFTISNNVVGWKISNN